MPNRPSPNSRQPRSPTHPHSWDSRSPKVCQGQKGQSEAYRSRWRTAAATAVMAIATTARTPNPDTACST